MADLLSPAARTALTNNPKTLPDGWRLVKAPDVPAGAPPYGSMWAVDDVSGAATPIAYDESTVIARAWTLKDRLKRMLVMRQNIPAEYINQIVTGDARELAKRIPDNSIDLAFCDPVYENMDDYAWLARTCARILKPCGACLVWCSSVKQYDVQPIMREHLTFVLPLTYTKVAKAYKVWGYKTFLWTTPCLWFQKDGDHFHKNHDWLIDTVIDHSNAIISTSTPPTDSYKWHKNPEAYVRWLQAFTQPGDIVYDPFTGSGSLPVECRRFGRNFIASELEPDIAEMARARVAATPVIDPKFEPEQSVMFDAPAQHGAARDGVE